MGWTIVNLENSIEFTKDSITQSIDKDNMHIKKEGDSDYVLVHNTIEPKHNINNIQINYNDVDDPTVTDVECLYNLLTGYKNSKSTVRLDLSDQDLATETTLRLLKDVIYELKKLNAMFSETFNSQITDNDIRRS